MLAIDFDTSEDLHFVHDYLEQKGYELEVEIAPRTRILVHGFDDAMLLGQVALDYVDTYGGSVISDTELDIE